MENAHSAFFAVVMHPKEAAGDRTCESADQLVVLMNRLLKKGRYFCLRGSCYLTMRCVTIKKVLSSSY